MLSIGSFSKLAHLPAKTLRYYDQIGLLKPAFVDGATGYRYYRPAQLQTVLLIGRLKAYGFTLGEVAAVLESPEDSTCLLSLLLEKKQHTAALLAGYSALLGHMDEEIANLERGLNLMSYLDNITVELADTQPMNLLYFRGRVNVNETAAHFQRLGEKTARQGLTPAAPPLCIFHSEEYTPESFDMEFAIPVQQAAEGTRLFAPGPCAHATLRGDYSGLPSVYAKIQQWMEAEGYTAAGPAFEFYATDPATTPPAENITEVYFPVKK